MSVEFRAFPKIPRLNKPIIVTEKIDGTNGCVVISQYVADRDGIVPGRLLQGTENIGGGWWLVRAQSRNRFVEPGNDNQGFAAWVYENAVSLVHDLGEGYHYGEWWGQGIQRGYGLDHKRFSLFNTSRWVDADFDTPNLAVVPVLVEDDTFNPLTVHAATAKLKAHGSVAAPGFTRPEGVVVFHTAANQPFKVLLENDDKPKSLTRADVELTA